MNNQTRRRIVASVGAAVAVTQLPSLAAKAAVASTPWLAMGARPLRDLVERLAAAPRRRSLSTVPMILDDPSQWDDEALQTVIAYRGGPKQVWDNTDIGGPWLNLMRNALNVQVWSFRHPDFLAVSTTHGTANLALIDQVMWDKYQLAKLAGERFRSNTLIAEPVNTGVNPDDYQSAEGAFSSRFNSIPLLQRRGVVFMACHNALWETAERLINAGSNPDRVDVQTLAAELTNHLVPGVVLTPGAVGTLPELQQVGFQYAK